MESDVIIRASDEEMEKFFLHDKILIKFMKKKKDKLQECLIRHDELPWHLKGTYTIAGLHKKIKEMKGEEK